MIPLFGMRNIALCAVAGLALTSGALGAWKLKSAAIARHELLLAEQAGEALREKAAALARQQTGDEKRAAAIAAENETLTTRIEQARLVPSSPAKIETALSRDVVEQRIAAALQQAVNGAADAALRELLWCWDEGVKVLDRNRRSMRRRSIAQALVKLGERHLPAMAALHERWTGVKVRFLQVGDIDEAISQFALLSDVLKQPGAKLALVDQLPEGDRRRTSAIIYARNELIEARRYHDVLVGNNAPGMFSLLELAKHSKNSPHLREHAINTAAQNVEVLAGAGELQHARELMQRVLQNDDRAETRALLNKHLERAGRPELRVGAEIPLAR